MAGWYVFIDAWRLVDASVLLLFNTVGFSIFNVAWASRTFWKIGRRGSRRGRSISSLFTPPHNKNNLLPGTTMVEQQQISPTAATTAISWTGGKDCNLTLLHAWRDPSLNVKYLLTFRPANKPFRAHPIPIMEAQAAALGLELLHVIIPEGTSDYMLAYVNGIRRIKEDYGITVIGTGDMDLVGTMERNWIERCCEQVGGGMRVYLPLWKADREECLDELLEQGIEVIFSCVKSPFFNGSWIGRTLNRDALAELRSMVERELTKEEIDSGVKPLDLCGERGEYHTMCVNGPLYQKRVVLDVNDEPMMEEIQNGTKWKGNIHNADCLWMLSMKDKARVT